MKENACCFSGHRFIASGELNALSIKLTEKIKELILKGVVNFCSGGAIGFDTIAAETVIGLKKEFPFINLVLILPCKEQDKFWTEKDKVRYDLIKKSADKTVYVSENFFNGCMQKRNRRLVDISDFCISYLKDDKGGTFYTVNYAERNGLKIYNIAK